MTVVSVRLLSAVLLVAVLLAGSAVTRAQGQIDSAFSDTVIRALGFPEVTVSVTPDGVEAPGQLPAGPTLITLQAAAGLIGYVDIMQPPAGLSDEEATALALAAAVNDLAQPDWIYLGGTNTPGPDETATFAIDLQPGEYQWAASIYGEGGAEERMFLVPLTVHADASAASPVATPVAAPLTSDVVLEMTDGLEYIVTPDTVPAGPRIWEIANTGQHSPHHVVMMRVPHGTTSEEIITEYTGMMAGTPPAGDSLAAQLVWVGYAALQSGGQTTWAEFDLEPANYAVICFIIDPATGRPHLLDGMVTVFTVA